jgi:hypothetical protein
MVTETTELRAQLMLDVDALTRRGFIKGLQPNALGRTTSYRNLAGDVLSLAGLLRSEWATISTRCGVSLEELSRAEVLADELLQYLGLRDRAPVVVAEATLDRQKVYTLCVRAYDQLRRAVLYVRWDRGDFDDFVPPLGGKRKRVRVKPHTVTNAETTSE